jgi:hypothetical protein
MLSVSRPVILFFAGGLIKPVEDADGQVEPPWNSGSLTG